MPGTHRQPKPSPLPDLQPLSVPELAMLREAPYDHPLVLRGTREVKIAQALVGRGLLERDPQTPTIVRVTEKGAALAKPLSRADAERVAERVADLADDDPEAAAGLERALWHRVLAEVADALESAQNPRVLAEIAKIALRTNDLEFPRW